ncbi:MAG: hypothetical protein J0L53_16470, partial [Spirochaetes bacterium]|nr:hypothetical protein [Spirochaetota bacterium]
GASGGALGIGLGDKVFMLEQDNINDFTALDIQVDALEDMFVSETLGNVFEADVGHPLTTRITGKYR